MYLILVNNGFILQLPLDVVPVPVELEVLSLLIDLSKLDPAERAPFTVRDLDPNLILFLVVIAATCTLTSCLKKISLNR